MLDVSWLNPSVELGEEAVLLAGVERPARRTKTRVRAARHDTERLRMEGGEGEVSAWECGLAHVRKSQHKSQSNRPRTRVEATREATCKRARRANVCNCNSLASHRVGSSMSFSSGASRSSGEQDTHFQLTQCGSFQLPLNFTHLAPWRLAYLRRKGGSRCTVKQNAIISTAS